MSYDPNQMQTAPPGWTWNGQQWVQSPPPPATPAGYGAPPAPPAQGGYGAPPPAQGGYGGQQPQPVQAGLDDFFNAPSTGGGPAIKFKDKPIGTKYAGIVARKITNADVRQQTDPSGRPLTYRDGRPKFVMVIPLIVPNSPEFSEGRATWWCKGAARDELVRAMTEAGVPEGSPPEEGAGISVELTGHRPIPGLNPQYLYKVTYVRPEGARNGQAAPSTTPVPEQPPAPPQASPQAAAQQPQVQAPPQGEAPAPPPDMPDDQAAILQRLLQGS